MAHRNRETIAQLSYNRDFLWFGLLRPQFAIYWFLGVWGTDRGPNRAKTTKKWIFLVLGAVLGETPADQILIAC